MSLGRVVSGIAASAAVAGCAVVAVGMSRAAGRPDAATSPASVSTAAANAAPHDFRPGVRPYVAPGASATPAAAAPRASSAPVPTSRPVSSARPSARGSVAGPARSAAPVSPRPTPRRSTPPVAVRGQSLPVRFTTGTATRVITVTAQSTGSTTATLQAWNKAPGGGWLRYGSAVLAHVGADGLSSAPSEYRSATPIGSFTLTQAFGHYADPGTALPYLQTTPSDWWISQAGGLYNTHQRCSSGCAFTRGAPNEHLYYETPYYNYAVVIDYNTRNAPGGVHQGGGSAFFLHVTDGYATAGCVAIPQANLLTLMRWLTPSAHPRILIGIG